VNFDIGVCVGVGLGFGQAGIDLPEHFTQQFWEIRLLRNNHDASKKAKRKTPGTNRIALLTISPKT